MINLKCKNQNACPPPAGKMTPEPQIKDLDSGQANQNVKME